MIIQTPNWIEWYHFRHQQECFKSGNEFETYVTSILENFHDDFMDPIPSGSLGDSGCDGTADSGNICYACYGQRPMRNAERELAGKISSDFKRCSSKWKDFISWNFITNAPAGPLCVQTIAALQKTHDKNSVRPLEIRLINPDKLWNDFLLKLDHHVLDRLFPGAPGIAHTELTDLLPLLETLNFDVEPEDTGGSIAPISPTKMDYNNIPDATRIELNSGRHIAPRIDQWYQESIDPTLYDRHASRFRSLYQEKLKITSKVTEIVERLYVSLAGPNFRMDAERANAAFAVVSYFFDACHIFESPPQK